MSYQDVRALNCISSILTNHGASKQPGDTLWHYTAAPGLDAMLTNQSIRATHYTCFNDRMEVILGYSLMIKAAHQRRWDGSGVASDIVNLLDRIEFLCKGEVTPALKRWPHGFPESYINDTYEYYIACFSEAGDDVSQWTNYSGGEGGYALGFDPKLLRRPFDLPRYTEVYFVPVVYNEDEQSRLIGLYLDAMINAYRKSAETDLEFDDAFFNHHAYKWLTAFSALASIFKHKSFLTEKEWRLILCFSPHDRSQMTEKLEFTPKTSLFARHYPTTFRRYPIRKIKIGPSRFQDASKRSIEFKLTKAKLGCEVEMSDSTYQTAR
ncbi:DUF2971 domain-containing protein [Belnapia sp. T18]|uniref:DUF2971 domain-containing protein n=1 Tax=Belnapia arida TaxID=2804533 RepID=A0ABS1UAN8_9PROT|nr:DUF2971 domain-containing protein [Belnapia arida]MBL6081752.1 DUF2971 domain-containing protein [Belnapia arida]